MPLSKATEYYPNVAQQYLSLLSHLKRQHYQGSSSILTLRFDGHSTLHLQGNSDASDYHKFPVIRIFSADGLDKSMGSTPVGALCDEVEHDVTNLLYNRGQN